MRFPGFKVMDPKRLRQCARLGGRRTQRRWRLKMKPYIFQTGSEWARECGRRGGLSKGIHTTEVPPL